MLALAKRQIVADRVDTLIKTGLGKLGAVRLSLFVLSHYRSHCFITQSDLTLARYTCVALQRLNGSAKKVKGKPASL